MKAQAEGELASLVHTRDVLVKQRTRLLNNIHALHVRHGVKLKKESLSSKRALKGLDIARFSALEQIEFRIVRDQALRRSTSTLMTEYGGFLLAFDRDQLELHGRIEESILRANDRHSLPVREMVSSMELPMP